VYLKPIAINYLTSTHGHRVGDPGSSYSAEAGLADPQGAHDGVATYVGFEDSVPANNAFEIYARFELPPARSVIGKVTLVAVVGHMGWGPDQTSDHQPFFWPRIYSGSRDSNAANTEGPQVTLVDPDNYYNRNQPGGGGPFVDYVTMTQELTTNPSGGGWKLDDFPGLQAGLRGECGKSGTTAAAAFITQLGLLVELATLGGFVSNIRHAASLTLRLERLPKRLWTVAVPMRLWRKEPMERLYLSHPLGPTAAGRGWGPNRLDRRATQVMKTRVSPEAGQVEYSALDLREPACLLWANWVTPQPPSPELNGIAYLDQGGGFTFARNQDAWVDRPGDGIVQVVQPNFPKVSRRGLLIEGKGDFEAIVHNYFPGGTGWTAVSSGDVTATDDPTLYVVDELGYRFARKVVFGAGGGTYYTKQVSSGLGNNANAIFCVRATVRAVAMSLVQNAGIIIRRNYTLAAVAHFNDFNMATGLWGALDTEIVNAIHGTDGEPLWTLEYNSGIPANEGGFSPDGGVFDLETRLGGWSLTTATLALGLVDVQIGYKTEVAVADRLHGVRSRIVTVAAGITREGDVFKIANPSDKRVFYGDRGMMVVELDPLFVASLVPSSDRHVFWKVFWKTDGTEYDRVYYSRATGTGGLDELVYHRRIGGSDFNARVDVPAGHVAQAGKRYRVWWRWLGSEGAGGYSARDMRIGFSVYTASLGVYSFTAAYESPRPATLPTADPTVDAASFALVGAEKDDGSDSSKWGDAAYRWWEARRTPVSPDEITWRA
jgi:hypothetical protein